MRYASRTAIKATLQIGENQIPVVVDAREVVNLRDWRGHYEGYLWSTQMPVSASFEGPLTLVFPSGKAEVYEFSVSILLARLPLPVYGSSLKHRLSGTAM